MTKKLLTYGLSSLMILVFCATLFLAGGYTERSLAKSRRKVPSILVSYQNGVMTLASKQIISIQFLGAMKPGNEVDYLTKLELEQGIGSRDLFEARQNLDRKRIKVVKVPPTRLVVLKGLTPRYK
jgi:hypothetical protein